jgi:hypothetical protein
MSASELSVSIKSKSHTWELDLKIDLTESYCPHYHPNIHLYSFMYLA